MKTMPILFAILFALQSNAQISDFETINFNKADRIALECKNETLHNLPELAHKLTSNLNTDVERFRAIYMWVCKNIANDYNLYSKNKHKRRRFKNDSLKLTKWNDTFKKKVFKKLLKDNTTICTGYAYLVKELSDLANLNCVIVDGFAKTSTLKIEELDMPNHSWNAVELDGKWYLCDPTWASGIPNPETNFFKFEYNDGFFLANPKLFAINHYPLDEKWLLIEDKQPTYNSFIEAPILYGKAYTNLNVHYKPEKFHNTIRKNENVIFMYELLKVKTSEDITFLIDNGYGNKKIHPKHITIKDKSLTINYIFEKNGFYDVHLLIGNDLISTYTFEVN